MEAQMPDETLSKISQWVDAWNSGDLDQLDPIFSNEILYHCPPFPDMSGLAAHKLFIQDARISYPDFHIQVDEILTQGSTSVIRWTWSGTFSGPSHAIPIAPTGRFGICLGCHVLHWKDEKVEEAWHIGDWLGLLTQYGVIPAMA
jgi:steroid delta-isomerase-like uncharacterized protein